ncbi:hypothetical protein POM88_000055 [Heracleum sosnowskyi]|uniref:Uncharacterized protein n=1 Tax=Heracleum sosnowskyi TaxID=360622 RepID=A0AAD8JDG5_9APIA|nr:hypothetical protein POM88_000055 [Heracleum sosnowskyi]
MDGYYKVLFLIGKNRTSFREKGGPGIVVVKVVAEQQSLATQHTNTACKSESQFCDASSSWPTIISQFTLGWSSSKMTIVVVEPSTTNARLNKIQAYKPERRETTRTYNVAA